MAAAILEQLKAQAQAKAAEAEANYWHLVARVARNEEVDPGEVLNVCDATADKSLLDFEADATAAEERLELAKKYATYPALQNKAVAIESEIARLNSEFSIVAKRHSETVQALQKDFNTLAGRLSDLPLIRRKLLDTPPAHLAAKIKTLEADRSRVSSSMKDATAAVRAAESTLHRLEAEVESARASAKKLGTKNSNAALASAESNLANFREHKLPPFQKAAAELQSRYKQIDQRLTAITTQILAGE